MSDQGRGLDRLQTELDALPDHNPTCRDAWCGHWERNFGEYEPHVHMPFGVISLYEIPDDVKAAIEEHNRQVASRLREEGVV